MEICSQSIIKKILFYSHSVASIPLHPLHPWHPLHLLHLFRLFLKRATFSIALRPKKPVHQEKAFKSLIYLVYLFLNYTIIITK
jgi:hypothetical protein